MTMPSSIQSMTHDFSHHGGFQQEFEFDSVTPQSAVFVSISEIGVVNGQLVPLQGAASLSVDNVVPGPKNVIVRGNIGWDSDIDVRLYVFTIPVPL
jgi:hypothetical protein